MLVMRGREERREGEAPAEKGKRRGPTWDSGEEGGVGDYRWGHVEGIECGRGSDEV